jgi:biotin carboxyl carrier protein
VSNDNDVDNDEQFSSIALENGVFETRVTGKFRKRKLYQKSDPRIIKAVIPGVVAEVNAAAGSVVRKGEMLMTLEAMKMLNRILSPQDGTVKAIRVKAGQKVGKDQVLIELA